MSHANYKDMLRDHEAHLRRLEGEKGFFSAIDGDKDEQDTIFALLDAAAEAEHAIIDKLQALLGND